MHEAALLHGWCGALEWAVCASAYPGQQRSGDDHLISHSDAGTVVAVVDALGHGDEAADVAELALVSLRQTVGRSPAAALTACHAALRGSRGAAITVVQFQPDLHRLLWAAVGNVDAAVIQPGSRRGSPKRWWAPLRGGVVGDRLPPLRDSRLPLPDRGVLVAATDGIATAFADAADPSLPVDRLARRLHEDHARSDDDALVLVARCC
ncbi:MAG: serine/threonine-protein phosphatase [Actinobacteria bacterium]|nr:serine/threonine-protein phosphatase [Actinomycetota bacterium]